MKARARLALFLAFGAAAAAVFVWGLGGLPKFGHYHGVYGRAIDRVAVRERHATNTVNSVTFDYRGIDTVGEEFILFAAVMGVTMLLRLQREESEGPPEDHAAKRRIPHTSDAVRIAALSLVAPSVLLGCYVVSHGHLTPGGGFQGGVVLAAGPALIYLAGRYLTFRQLSPIALLDFAEGAGAAGFVIVGVTGLLAGASFLSNVWPLGRTVGSIFSGGMLPAINVSVGLEVAAGTVFVVWEFLEQTLAVRRRSG